MYKIAVVGDKESILGFSAIGMDIYPAYEEAEIKNIFPKVLFGANSLCKILKSYTNSIYIWSAKPNPADFVMLTASSS